MKRLIAATALWLCCVVVAPASAEAAQPVRIG